MRSFFGVLALGAVFVAHAETLSFREALDRAKAASPTLKAARFEREAATQARRAAVSRRLPQLNATGYAANSKPGAVLAPIGGMGGPMMMPAGRNWVANLMVMVPLWSGGRLESGIQEAAALERAAQGALDEMESETRFMVAESYLMAVLAHERTERENARVTAAQEMLRTTEARVAAGMDVPAMGSRAKAELAMAQRELKMAEGEKQKAILELQAVLGLDLAGDLTIEPKFPNETEATLEESLALATKQRGLLRDARGKAEAEAARRRGMNAMSLPRLDGVAMTDASNNEMMRGGTLGLTLSVPLVDAGERRADQQRMRAMQSAAEAEFQQKVLQVAKEVRQAYVDVATARANLTSAEASVTAASEAYDVVRLRVEAGKAILLEQLDALSVLTQTKADLAQANYDLSLARARIDRATGGSR